MWAGRTAHRAREARRQERNGGCRLGTRCTRGRRRTIDGREGGRGLNEQTPRPEGSGDPGRRPRGPGRRRRPPRGPAPSGQAFAENRSRPIYPETPRSGNRRRPFRNGSAQGGRPTGAPGDNRTRRTNSGRPNTGRPTTGRPGSGYARSNGGTSNGGYRGPRPYGTQGGYRND